MVIAIAVEDGVLREAELEAVPEGEAGKRRLARDADASLELRLMDCQQQRPASARDGGRAIEARGVEAHAQSLDPFLKWPSVGNVGVHAEGHHDGVCFLADAPLERLVARVLGRRYRADGHDLGHLNRTPGVGPAVVGLVDGARELAVVARLVDHVPEGGALECLLARLVSRDHGHPVDELAGVAQKAHVHLELPEVVKLGVVQGQELHWLEDLPHCPVGNSQHATEGTFQRVRLTCTRRPWGTSFATGGCPTGLQSTGTRGGRQHPSYPVRRPP